MKQVALLVLVLAMVFAFTGCGKTKNNEVPFKVSDTSCGETKNIEFPFEVIDVETIVAYRYHVPTHAEKKILTESDDIEAVISAFSGITLRDKKVEEHDGSTVTCFRFNLADGTSYNIIHVSEDVKSGTLMFSDDDTKWFTSADIGVLWNTGDSDVVKADMSELPSLK